MSSTLPASRCRRATSDLDRKSEQELREIVVQERRDLHALVLALLGHPVRERAKYVFAILELLVRLLERLATEEHLPRKKKREDRIRGTTHHCPLSPLKNFASMRPKTEDRDSSPDIAEAANLQLPYASERIHPEMDAGCQ